MPPRSSSEPLRVSCSEELDLLLLRVPDPGSEERRAAEERQARLTKPVGSLGRLESLATWLAAWQRRSTPSLDRVHCLVFAGNHGVAGRGVSAYPPEVTRQMVANFEAGGAAINQLCRLAQAELTVIPLSLDEPTRDLVVSDAMSESECAAAMQTGIDAVPGEADLLLIGEMGIGNTTSASALAMVCFGGDADEWVGAGTGVEGLALENKRRAVQAAVDRVVAAPKAALGRLAQLGGRELAAMAGAVLAARWRSIPVVLDGFVATAAVAPLAVGYPGALDHVVLGHVSAEAGHRHLAACLGKTPLLDLGMRLGEASGAAVAALVLRAAVETHRGMATFAEAGVSERDDGAND